jgi:hypothetical protein
VEQAIVRHAARTWNVLAMYEVMTAFVIMHNMTDEPELDDIIHDQRCQLQAKLVKP